MSEANREWSARPADERFPSVEAMLEAVQKRQDHTSEGKVLWKDMSVRPNPEGGGLVLNGRTKAAEMNWHSFGQLCAKVKAPAPFLRELDPKIASDALNSCIQKRGEGEARLLLDVQDSLTVRAILSPDYTRIWDLDVVKRLVDLKAQGVWQEAPAAFDGSRGQYAGQSNMFSFMVDNNRRIFEEEPGGGLSRGVFVWNSEVGDKKFGMKGFHYKYICGNHYVWGATGVHEFSVVHRGNADARAFHQLEVELKKYAEASQEEEVNQIKAAKKYRLGATAQEVLDLVFGKLGLTTKALATKAIEVATQHEEWYGDPYTAWGFASGLTEVAKEIPNADDRVEVEKQAGKVLMMSF